METTIEQARDLFRRLEGAGGQGDGTVLSAGFLLRALDGTIELADAGATPNRLRLIGTALGGMLEGAGNGYLIASATSDDGLGVTGAWLIIVHRSRVAAALEYESHAAALEAVPAPVRIQSDVELVRTAVWAFVERDVSMLLSLLAEDFTYTDDSREFKLDGASETVGKLLLEYEDLRDRGLSKFELEDLGDGMIQSSGILTRRLDPTAPPDQAWLWTTVSKVADGKIAWTIRQPDQVIETG